MVIDTQREILGAYADQGFSLEEPDDDILILNHQGEFVGRFFQTKVTKWIIQQNCDVHLAQHQTSKIKSCR